MTNGDEQDEQEDDLWRRLNISSLAHTFKAFDKVKGSGQAYDLLWQLARGESDRKFVMLYGITGSGKTHLIEAMLIEWANRGISAGYRTMSQIMRHLKQGIGTGFYDEYFKRLCEMPRLVIDDVGMGTIESRFEIADLEDIIAERYHRRYHPVPVVTIMATNKNIQELPNRITSRFYDPEFGAVALMECRDYRRRKL